LGAYKLTEISQPSGQLENHSTLFKHRIQKAMASEPFNHPIWPLTPTLLSQNSRSWSLVQLKDTCRERQLRVSGTKAMLVSRLEDDDGGKGVPMSR
jgi:hypothetical protein